MKEGDLVIFHDVDRTKKLGLIRHVFSEDCINLTIVGTKVSPLDGMAELVTFTSIQRVKEGEEARYRFEPVELTLEEQPAAEPETPANPELTPPSEPEAPPA